MTFLLTMIAVGVWMLVLQIAHRPTALDAMWAAEDAADDEAWRALSPKERDAWLKGY
jgi:hypothetical protein